MKVEMHRADPRLRRLASLLLPGILLLGGLGVWVLHSWLEQRTGSLAGNDGLILLAAGLVSLLATVSFSIGVALWLEARRIQREDRFPPSDMRTLRDVPIRHGPQALRYARYMFAAAVVAGLGGIAILAWGYWLLRLAV